MKRQKKDNKKTKNDKKKQILSDYAKLAESLDRPVSMGDLIDAGHTKDAVAHHFRSLTKLDNIARDRFPNKFSDVSVKSLLGPKAVSRLQGAVVNYNRFVIATAVTGCDLHSDFYRSIQTYCSHNNAVLLVLVQSDPAHNRKNGDLGYVDKKLMNDHIVVADTALNSNLYISTIKLSAKHIDPITGLGRIGQRNGSFIYASPKQRLKSVPVSNSKLPHFIMTTGAITKPNYTTENYMSERTAYIAEHDHVVGALIVEVEDEEIYHFRQIQADEHGHFIDLGKQYRPNCVMEEPPAALVLGDWHSGEVDPIAASAWFEAITLLKPKKLVLHDLFNGLSINHHEDEKNILRAQRANRDELNLMKELAGVAQDLDVFAGLVEQVIVCKSNHDEFLERYLQEGKYVKDPQNHRFALDLAAAMMDGNDPLRVGTEIAGLQNANKIVWLKRDEDYRIACIQLGAHGDKGANGARGSLPAMEAAYGNSVTGHSHVPEILRGAWSVGTSTYLKLTYNVGPSSWFHSSVVLYSNGSRQIINSINGKWRLDK